MTAADLAALLAQTGGSTSDELAPWGIGAALTALTGTLVAIVRRIADGRLVPRDLDAIDKTRTAEISTLHELVTQAHKREAEMLRMLRDRRRQN